MSLLLTLGAILAAAPAPMKPGVETKVAKLAEAEASSTVLFSWPVFDDPAFRAEARRVGLPRFCDAVDAAASAAVQRNSKNLRPFAEQAIRTKVPAERLAETRIISFVTGPLSIYKGRVREEFERLAGSQLAQGRESVRVAVRSRLAGFRDARSTAAAPPADLDRALGLNGHWNFDNPGQLVLACADRRIDPRVRPTITTGLPTRPLLTVPVPNGAEPQ